MGSIVTAYGARLATRTESAISVPLPSSLAGTNVDVRDSSGAGDAGDNYVPERRNEVPWMIAKAEGGNPRSKQTPAGSGGLAITKLWMAHWPPEEGMRKPKGPQTKALIPERIGKPDRTHS